MIFFNWKKQYFEKKLLAVRYMILDLEFKRFKTLEIREEIRKEYDNKKSRLELLEKQIKEQKEKPTMEKGEIARFDDEKVKLEEKIKEHEAQMKELDLEIYGTKPNAEYKNGVQGINDQLTAIHELIGMLKSYIKNEL